MTEKETIYGEVVSKANNYQAVPDKNGTRRIIKNKKIRTYERLFDAQCKIYRDRHIDSGFVLNIDVYFLNGKHDLDNAVKTICDCLQYVGAISDDNLMMRLNARKFVTITTPRVEFSIERIDGTLF